MIKSAFFSAIATLALTSPALAQQTPYPAVPEDQRWDRASRLATVSMVAAIRHAEAVGQDFDEFARWWVDLFDDSWGEPGTGTPAGVMGGVRRNHLAFHGGEVEILESSQDRATARLNAPYRDYFGDDGVFYGVTLDEYEALFSIFLRGIAEYKGLAYEERREGDDWVVTLSRR